jgi:hypothetical protein
MSNPIGGISTLGGLVDNVNRLLSPCAVTVMPQEICSGSSAMQACRKDTLLRAQTQFASGGSVFVTCCKKEAFSNSRQQHTLEAISNFEPHSLVETPKFGPRETLFLGLSFDTESV